MNEQLDDAFETFIRTGIDSKGRTVGYVVGLREVLTTGECYAWVQYSVSAEDGWKDFGPVQRSRKFATLEAAKTWAYATAKERSVK